jgi:hypothetical protein
VGAIMILAALGLSLVYVNAYYVPRQGVSLEIQARDEAEQAFLDMSEHLSGEPFPFVQELPLKSPRAPPPLLDGVVLSPVRVDGVLGFNPQAAVVTISHVTVGPPPAPGDPTRVDLGGGLVRVYSLGNSTSGLALGGLNVTLGGAYLERATYALQGGAVIVKRDSGSTLVAPPVLQVTRSGVAGAPITVVTWRVPVLVGSVGEVGGRETAQVSFVPGPLARAGNGQAVYGTTITIQTRSLAAWTSAMQAVVGDLGTVTSTPDGVAPDAGTITVDIGAPQGAPAGVPSVTIDYSAVRYTLGVTSRSSR